MSRYFSAPPVVLNHRTSDDWNWPLLSDIHAPDSRPVDTGLVDAHGKAIMRAPNPMGFGRDGEW
jgi:hypothetical protein